MRISALLYLILFASTQLVFSQTAKIDSLFQEHDRAKADTTKVNILLDIVREYDLDDSAGLVVARKAFELANQLDNEKILARSEASLGLIYYDLQDDSASILLNKAIARYKSIGLENKISDTYKNKSIVLQGRSDFDSAIYYLEKSLQVAQENNYLKGMAEANYSLSTIRNTRGENSLALKNSLKAKEYYEKAGMQLEVSQSLNQVGIVYDYMGLYADALENYLQAREIAIEVKDVRGEILIINNLGVTYDNMKNSEVSLKYFEEALEKASIYEFKEDEATLLNNISYSYLNEGDTGKAKGVLWRAIKTIQELDIPCFEIYPLEGVGSIYVEQNMLDSAQHYLDMTLEKALICEDVGILTAVYKNLGKLYEKKGEFTSAIKSLNESRRLAENAVLSADIEESLLALYEFHKNRGDNVNALLYLEKHRFFTDSLQNNQNIEKANQLVAEYDFRKQVELIKAEQLASERILQEEIKTQELASKYILLALILLALLLITMARSYYLIQRQNKKLKWLNEEKNTLMGVVAHDLRNPLNMIKGLMQLIVGVKTENKEDDADKYLHLIDLSTQKMTNMIDKVLDISAIENMKVNLDISKEDLTKLLNKVMTNFEFLAAKKNINIIQQYDENVAHYSHVDANYFDQVLDNLISNSIKFSESDKNIYLDVKSEDGINTISVKDEGPGIGDEEQKSIFNKFRTLAAKPTSNEKSTGLGLSIAQKFVNAMEGEISCVSELGKGTTFFIKFKTA